MKSKFFLSLFILVLLAGSFLPAGLAPVAQAVAPTAGPPWYARGDWDTWAAPGVQLYDDGTHGDVTPADNVFTSYFTVTNAGRYEWKVTDDGTNWFPPSNAWLVTTSANQRVTFTFDTNTRSDGWSPSQNIVNVRDGVTTWTAVGDWQGWNNGDPATAMHPYAGGLYAYTGVVTTAGTHQLKVCRTGTYDCIGPQGTSGGRSVNTDNLDFSTTIANQRVLFLANLATGRIRAVPLGVVLNEFASKGTEFVELYNPLTATVDISSWQLRSAIGGMNYTFPGGTSIPTGGYLSYASGSTQDNNGDIITLTNAAGIVVDNVGFGNRGGAPSPHTANSTGRAPNGVDTDDWARDWNLDTTPTNGAANDQPAANLGSSLVVNEVRYGYTGLGYGFIELYNPTTSPVVLTNWRFSDGDVAPPLVITSTPGVTIQPGGFFVFATTSATFISNNDEIYLFQPDYVRVDQVGFFAQTMPITRTAQRVCDGDGPHDGYNWVTTGGGTTWMVMPPTLGVPNCLPDAAIAKDGPSYVGTSGGNIDYILSYEMTGGAAGQNLVVTDTLPAGVTYVAFTSTLPVTLTSSNPVVFDAGDLAGLSGNVIILTAHVPSGLPFGTVLTNTVALHCDDDTNLGNNQDTFTTTVVGSETGIEKAGPSFVLPGQAIAYTLTYTVDGDPAQGVVITDVLPLPLGAVTYVSDTAPVVPTEPTPGTWRWSLGTVAAGTHSFVVHGLVSTNPMTWTLHNVAEVHANNDTDPANNQSSWDTDMPMPIYAIQHVDVISGTSPSPYVGQHVLTIGVVTAGSRAYPSYGNPVRYVIGDPNTYGPWQGLFVYDTHVVTEGQLLVLGGMIQEYYGMTELYNIDYFQLLDETWPVPNAILTTTAAISTVNPQTAEPLESVLVEVSCAEVTRLPNSVGEWLVTDASNVAAMVDDMATYAYSPTLGDILTVRGILFYDYDNYRMEPRGNADIVPGVAVVATGPADGAADVPVNAVVTATFSISLNPSTVTTATFYLEGPGGVPIPGTVSYDAGARMATFTPAADLANSTTYIAHATTGIESVGGVALCAEYTWSFTTVALPEPDLRDSSKLADRLQVQAGSTMTYTIRLLNSGDLTATALLTDVVPAEVTVITPTLPPGMVYDNGRLLWSGQVYPNQAPILLPFQVQVNTSVPTGTVVVNVVQIDDGVHFFTRSVSVQVTGAPDIVVSPPLLSAILQPGQSTVHHLFVANVGGADLFWMLSEVPVVNWLSESPDNALLPPGEQTDVAVTFNATGLSVGSYTTTLDVYSTDPDEPHVYVDVTLVVTTGCIPVTDPLFDWSPLTPTIGQAVTFNGTALGLEPITYTWNFGDGNTGSGTPVIHTYTAAGTYTVLMTATNACGQATMTHVVTVVAGCQPPSGAGFTWAPLTPAISQTVNFNGSVQGGTPPFTYDWTFGDGGTATGQNVSHVYVQTSTYTVTLTVGNGCGTTTATHRVTVVAVPVPSYTIYLPVVFKSYGP